MIKGGEKLSLFVIGDLHLSFGSEKPMDIFGEQWTEHPRRIAESWLEKVKECDVVLVPGDISWALKLKDAMIDLEWLNDLPGKKICIKGNHDYWWQTISKLNTLYENVHFLQNNCYFYEDYAICGTRGWLCPNDSNFSQKDTKIYLRELNRLELSLKEAKKNGCEKIIVMLHYPPHNENKEVSGFEELFKKYGVETVVYAHLHGKKYYDLGVKGNRDGIQYHLTSCDYLNFEPLRIL